MEKNEAEKNEAKERVELEHALIDVLEGVLTLDKEINIIEHTIMVQHSEVLLLYKHFRLYILYKANKLNVVYTRENTHESIIISQGYDSNERYDKNEIILVTAMKILNALV